MLGKRSSQRSLFDAEYHFQELVGRDSFHWQLGQARDQLFRDEDFAALYGLDNGRPSVPPSLLATALLTQARDKVSDAEVQRRTRLDLGVEADGQQFESGINNQIRTANEHKSGITWNTAPLWHSHNRSYPEYLPTTNSGPLYQAWYQSDGERGEAPPDLRQQPLLHLYGTARDLPSVHQLSRQCGSKFRLPPRLMDQPQALVCEGRM